MVEIHLLGVPVDTWKRASAHQEGLQREFEILVSREPDHQTPRALIELIDDLRARFHQQRDQSLRPLMAAAEKGESFVDVTFELPNEAAASLRQLSGMLDAADEFCREGGRLLTQVTPPDLLAFRRWFLGEILSQLEEGKGPRRWQVTESWVDEASEAAAKQLYPSGDANGVEDNRIEFKEDLDLSTAGILHDQIVTARSGKMRPGTLVVDLREVGFMDSVGISLLVSAYKRVTEDGTTVRLVLPSRLRRLLEISGLIEVLRPEFVSVEEAPMQDGDT